MTDILLILVLVAVVVNIVLLVVFRPKDNDFSDVKNDIIDSSSKVLQNIRDELVKDQKDEREYLVKTLNLLSDNIRENQESFSKSIATGQSNFANAQEERFSSFAVENTNRLNNISQELSKSLDNIRKQNSEELEKMRKTVDQKLETTLEARLTSSFSTVSENLEKVQKGLGEMTNLASDVGGLKKMLSNVKQRGILGEIQLKMILSEILSPSQYVENVATVNGSSEKVEFAVKFPGGENGVLLPIDSKFPGDTYYNLQEAYESGDKDKIYSARKALSDRLKGEAKEIGKYINPPNTTDFAVMFLPFEGLYAEVVNMGMIEELQKNKINICGPSTMAAFLNSLSLGFKTFAIQERSHEVFELLQAVKTEFGNFEKALEKVQKNLNTTENSLQALVTTRTNAIKRKLKNVEELDGDRASLLLGIDNIDEE